MALTPSKIRTAAWIDRPAMPTRIYGDVVRGLRLNDSPAAVVTAFGRHRIDGHSPTNCAACADFIRRWPTLAKLKENHAP